MMCIFIVIFIALPYTNVYVVLLVHVSSYARASMDLLDMLFGDASRMEPLQLFEKFEENIETTALEQIDVRGHDIDGHEVVTPMMQSGNPNQASSSSKWSFSQFITLT